MAGSSSTADIGFEQQIWAAADILRGNMDASEYKHVLLGLIFLKYISDKFDERYRQLLADDDDVEDKDAYTEVSIFYVPPTARWRVISETAHREEIGTVIDDAMRAIEKENKRLKDILPKNYARGDLDKRRLGNVVDLFTNIQMVEHGTDKDILGRTYEYCLQQFASKEGKRGGEFYTPSCMVRTLVAVLKPTAEHRIYDPCCGSGGMFVQSERFVREHSGERGRVSIYGQDSNPTTRKLAMMNLAIRGIEADLGSTNADTFHHDLHPQLKADYILANPPFNLSDWNDGSLNDDPRWKYGLPPMGNANFAWLQHMIYHLAPNGKIGMVLANGSLSSQIGSEGEIRRKIVEDDLVEGIIAMPSNLFYGVTIPATLWFVSRNKKQTRKTLFIDARKMGTLIDRVHRELSDAEIEKLAATFEAFNAGTLEDIKGYCAAVSTEEIAKQNYILTPGRYVGIAEQADDGEPFEEKMTRLTGELSEMFRRSHELEDEIRRRLGAIGYEI
ncbi:MAG: class I SAM-dependent DNA methyltransferase [Clostridia bacterium]